MATPKVVSISKKSKAAALTPPKNVLVDDNVIETIDNCREVVGFVRDAIASIEDFSFNQRGYHSAIPMILQGCVEALDFAKEQIHAQAKEPAND